MTVADQLKIIDNKINPNQAQYDLDRLAAKISAYTSGDLRKYEYLTGEDLGYKPSVLEKAKFEYSSLSMTLNKAIKPLALLRNPLNMIDSGLRYGSYSFVEIKRDAEKFKKIPSLDSKNMEIKRFLEKLNEFKKSPLRKCENKEEKDFVKKTPKKIYHDEYYNVYKKHYNREKTKLIATKKKRFDYKKLKLTDEYDYTSDEEEDIKANLDEETKNFIEEFKEKEKGIDEKGI